MTNQKSEMPDAGPDSEELEMAAELMKAAAALQRRAAKVKRLVAKVNADREAPQNVKGDQLRKMRSRLKFAREALQVAMGTTSDLLKDAPEVER